MRPLIVLSLIAAVAAVPGQWTNPAAHNHKKDPRQASLPAPPPCQPIAPPPDEATTRERFDQFAHAFLVTKNITEAFTYINEGYINHNPAARNGSASAWNLLSPIWGSQNITVLRTAFSGNTGWLNYLSGGLGEIVDRYRWEAGCIAEHVKSFQVAEYVAGLI